MSLSLVHCAGCIFDTSAVETNAADLRRHVVSEDACNLLARWPSAQTLLCLGSIPQWEAVTKRILDRDDKVGPTSGYCRKPSLRVMSFCSLSFDPPVCAYWLLAPCCASIRVSFLLGC